ncbi:DNA-directed RNA polymerase I core subunit [Pichia kluyveri]|uniref:DNA-directed RNA polymerase subunit n=1 Tax=Pichia kluyveri TaxID=36015 RepID=A0AAV5R6S8_PICKL|nr:DNA-directed RNA polymerase I core subunit [Pichia kluyveri]
MDIARPVGSEITHVDFGILSADEIRKLSAKQITNPTVFDNLGHPVSGGLYDPALGAFLKNICSTCGLNDIYCPGHQGHIELPVPVYNPLFFNQLYIFLRTSCLYCNHFKLNSNDVHKFECKLKLLQYGLIIEASELDMIKIDSNEILESEESLDDKDTNNFNDIDSSAPDAKLSVSSSRLLREKRELFVFKAINNAIEDGRTTKSGVFTATVGETRKQLITDFYSKVLGKKKCENCGLFSSTFRKDGFSKIFENALKDKESTNNRIKLGSIKNKKDFIHLPPKTGSKYVLSTEVKNIMNALFNAESSIIDVLFHSKPLSSQKLTSDMFFINALVVPATRFRLPSKLGEEIHENSQNELLTKVLNTSLLIRDLNDQFSNLTKDLSMDEKKIIFNRLMNAFVTLQNDVNGFIDSTKNQNNNTKTPTPGIKQALEKKEGLFRKHMMGKRVNYAARSVISPDPNLETNEIGVPPVFAVKLTYPEPVTNYNVSELRQAVINGPDKWPGATQVQNEDGSLISLIGMSLEQRKSIASQLMTPTTGFNVVNKKVHRHIKNNDVVLMNRQPTLHKASMMGHKVRVLPGEKTLRLHYANTGAYNADFDGDEMNMHFPQNENARAEAFNLANTDSQYLTPTSGSPVRGLIQDHISAGVWLTNKDSFFTREKYQELIYSCIRPEEGHSASSKIVTLPPTIFKPIPLWTGKQVISTILLNIKPLDTPGINLISKNKIKNDYWGEGSKENDVIFKDGELICGILDKSQYGSSKYGIIHSLHEVYGPEVAGKALSVLGRLFTTYIMMIGFTCGMDDLRLTDEGNKWRNEIIKESIDTGRIAATEVTNLDSNTEVNDKEFQKRLEEILRDDNKLAILDAVTMSKVNAITSKVVSTCVPNGTMKRFPYNSMQAMALSGAKGSNVNVSQIMCLLGQQALEGRRVPVMVSGKTLPCFKPFETDARAGGYVKNRFYSGIRPQEYYFHCMAGREGLIDTAVKTANSGYLQRCLTKQLEGATINYDNTVRNSDGTMIQFMYGGDSIDVTKESYLYEFKFFVDNYNSLLQRYSPSNVENLDAETAIHYNKKAKKHSKKQGDIPHFEDDNKYDPTISLYNPARYLGSVSDKFEEKLDSFIEQNEKLFVSSKEAKNNGGLTSKKFKALMQLKYMRSLINPGEAVGIIASQSVGEPSTQMTLNTFHFAGHGAANVTLGIPRLREIVMTASASIKTPQMTLPILDDVDDESADAFCKSITKIKFSEFIDDVSVIETTADVNAGINATRSYQIKIKFFDSTDYQEEYDVTKEELENTVRSQFIYQLESVIAKELRKQKLKTNANMPDIGVAVAKTKATSKISNEEGSDEKSRTKQAVSYEDPDDEELEAMKEAEKSDDDIVNASSSDSDSSDDESSDSENDNDDEMDIDTNKKDKESLGKRNLSKLAKARQHEVIVGHTFVTEYDFDDENGSWCDFKLELSAETQKLLMVNIVEDVCKKCVVREVKNIGRCLHPSDEQGVRQLVTEGVNFQEMWEHDSFINVNNIRSNDVAAVLKVYGVEAARNTIVNEINRVFGTYAISVSSRHLDLIADYMTREGTYLAFNRQGIDSCTSSFMKMSYETTCQFLTKAVLNSDREDLKSPSARIVMGKLNLAGTGAFDLMSKMPEA